mmetsp:Transcript_78521/g.176004  ORF Transcript_78521/g.176004 Transcript_78521/m.176004 type:complete len:215 (-) Transcript_78521:194-838(-)
MSLLARAPVWRSLASPWPNTSVMKRARMCSSSSTTSSALRRPAPKSLRFLVAFRAPSVTSRPLRLTLRPSRSGLRRRRRAPLRPCRQSMYLLTISRTLPRRPPSPTSMPRLCCRGRLLSSVSTPQSIPWTPPRACLTPPLLASATTISREARRRFCRTTSRCRTSLQFWAWMSSVRKTSSLWLGPARCSASSPSPSSSQRSSPVLRAPLWISRQ